MIVLLAENEGTLQRIVEEFDRVCKRTKLRVNAGKSKVMVLERVKEQVIDFAKPYRVRAEGTTKYRIRSGEERIKMTEFKYSGTVLCKHDSMEGEVRERAVKGRQVGCFRESYERKKCKHGGK